MKRILRYIRYSCIAMLCAACTTDNNELDTLMPVVYSDVPVTFGGTDSDAQTQGASRGTATENSNLSDFTVTALYYATQLGSPSYFFNHQKVTKSASSWSYTPLHYWPHQGDIDFFAYSPTDIKGDFHSLTLNRDVYPDWLLHYSTKSPIIGTLNELAPTAGKITASAFDKAKDAENQQDLLLAVKLKEQCSSKTIESKVTMNFTHTLAGLDFQFANDYDFPTETTHVILAIAPMCTGGTIAYDAYASSPERTIVWTLDESEATYYQGYALDADNQLLTEGKTFFLPPQSLKNFAVTARFYHHETDDHYTLLDTRLSTGNNLELKRGVTQTLTLKKQ